MSRKADIIYYCYFGEPYTYRQATITELTAELCSLVGYKYKVMIRQRLKDTKKLVEDNAGLAQFAEFQLTKERANKLRYCLDLEDDELITEDNKIIIAISNEKDYDLTMDRSPA